MAKRQGGKRCLSWCAARMSSGSNSGSTFPRLAGGSHSARNLAKRSSAADFVAGLTRLASAF